MQMTKLKQNNMTDLNQKADHPNAARSSFKKSRIMQYNMQLQQNQSSHRRTELYEKM